MFHTEMPKPEQLLNAYIDYFGIGYRAYFATQEDMGPGATEDTWRSRTNAQNHGKHEELWRVS